MNPMPFAIVGLSLFINPVLAQTRLRRQRPYLPRRNPQSRLRLAFCLVAGCGHTLI
jgi:hypothetical protein